MCNIKSGFQKPWHRATLCPEVYCQGSSLCPRGPERGSRCGGSFWLQQVLAARTIRWLIYSSISIFFSLHQNNSTQIIPMFPKVEKENHSQKTFPRFEKKKKKPAKGMDLLSNTHFRKPSGGMRQCNGQFGPDFLVRNNARAHTHAHKYTGPFPGDLDQTPSSQ